MEEIRALFCHFFFLKAVTERERGKTPERGVSQGQTRVNAELAVSLGWAFIGPGPIRVQVVF